METGEIITTEGQPAGRSHSASWKYDRAGRRLAAMEITGGIGPDACIDAVGMEAHTPGIIGAYDRVKQAVMLQSDRPNVLRQAIRACRKGGTVSVPGVYGGFDDKIPLGSFVNKALTH